MAFRTHKEDVEAVLRRAARDLHADRSFGDRTDTLWEIYQRCLHTPELYSQPDVQSWFLMYDYWAKLPT